MDELSKTYRLAHSPDGWRVHLADKIASGFRVEPHYNLVDVIDRIETLYPEYRPHLTTQQLADYQLQVARRGHAQELQKVISQASDLKDGLVDLTRKLPEIGAAQDRDIAEDLATLHHQLSDLRAHVDIARREVARGKRVGSAESRIRQNGSRSKMVPALMRSIPPIRTGKPRNLER